MSLFLIGCAGPAKAEAERLETLRAAVGMDVQEFNIQSIIVRQSHPLCSTHSAFITIDEPHLLEISLNGMGLGFLAGGQSARTYVGNTLVKKSLSGDTFDYGRISMIRFDMNRGLITLTDALSLARDACAGMNAAGLAAVEGAAFAAITECLGQMGPSRVEDEDVLRTTFTNQVVRAVSADLCRLQDSKHNFAIEITNYRRAHERFSGGGDESDVLEEKSYRVSGTLLQNLG